MTRSQSSKSKKATQSRFARVWRRSSRGYATPPDVIFGLSEAAINKFLVAHYNDNPDFYNRSREKQPNQPIYETVVDDHGTQRHIKFWAKAEPKDAHTPAVAIDLMQSSATAKRLEAWWKTVRGEDTSPPAVLPPNAKITFSDVTLQVDFPAFDDPSSYHSLDLPYSVVAECYIKLDDDIQGNKILRLISWDISVAPVGDPLNPDPTNSVWKGVGGAPDCEAALNKLRLLIRDLFVLGANVALTQLARSLTVSLPLPPIQIVKDVNLTLRELFVTDTTIAVSAGLGRNRFAEKVEQTFQLEMGKFQEELQATDLKSVVQAAPIGTEDEIRAYYLANVPALASMQARCQELKKRARPKASRRAKKTALPTSDLFIMVSGNVFDALAKALLNADKAECTPWYGPDLGLGKVQGRACYWMRLSNAHGSLSGTNVSMGCAVDIGGRLDLEACVTIPCLPDICATFSPGIGLKGPLGITVVLSDEQWTDNKALKIGIHVDDFPGLEVYGPPPGLDKLINFLLNLISSAIFTAFLNAILSSISIYIVEIPLTVPDTNVNMTLSDFGISNVGGLLTLTGSTTFS